MKKRSRRVVITGLGIVSPLGGDKESFWQALINGQSAVAPWTLVAPDALPVPFGAEARQFRGVIDDFGPLGKEQAKSIRKGLKVMCRECQMGCAAAQKAMADAGLEAGSFDPERVGIAFGTDHMVTMPEDFSEGILNCLDDEGQFDFSRWATEGLPKMNPLWLLKYLPNMPACHLAMYNDLRGPNNSMTLREAAANVALIEAFQTVVHDRADAMVVGATGTRIHPIKAIHTRQQEELADGAEAPARACRPFDRERTGMVLGEGAGAVVIEDWDRAVARGAPIYAEVFGGASSSVAGPDRQADRYQALRNAMQMTFSRTKTSLEAVGFINAHGLSTRSADVEEARAIRDVFAERSTPLPVVAPKSHFGNLGAGSGMVELIAGVLALNHGQLFPVLNFENPDPDCPIAPVVAGQPCPSGACFLNLSFTPQGQASVALVGQVAEPLGSR